MRGDGRIYRQAGSANFWMQFYLNGDRHRESTGQTDEKEARKVLKARLKKVHVSEVTGAVFESQKMRRLLIHDLLESLKAKYGTDGKDSRQNLSHLRRADADLGHLPACSATAKHFRDYKKERLAKGDAAAAVHRPLQMVRAAYRLALKREELARMPFIEIPKEIGNERQGFFSEQQIAEVLAHLPNDGLRDFAEWASLTGQRKSEIAAMTWNMLTGNEIYIPAGFCKNKTARAIPLGPELQAVITRREKARRVVSMDGTAQLAEPIFHRAGLPVGDFKKSWRTAVKAANCPTRLFHDLRRTVARRLLAAGIPQTLAMAMMGMESDAIFKRYAIADAALKLAAQKKVARFRKQA